MYIYTLFLLAPLVTNLGSHVSLEECERVLSVIASARHEGNIKDAETFGKTRLKCVKVKNSP